MVKAKAVVEECQDARVETRAKVNIKFTHQTYPTHKQPIKIPFIVGERNEHMLFNETPLLMDCMFVEDSVME